MDASPTGLSPLPPTFAGTRDALHQLAFFAIAPKRHAKTGRLGLRATPNGFGTPPWDDGDGQGRARMALDQLVLESGNEVSQVRPTTVRHACEFLGLAYEEVWFPDFHDPPAPVGPDTPLKMQPDAAAAVASWFAFSTSALEELRATPGAIDVSEVQLWPEHFDLATELGSTDAGQRASYGASPGDADHPTPYLYVAAWGEIDRDAEPYWNDTAFNGASLTYEELLAADDPRSRALAFLRRGHEVLAGN